MDFHFLFHNPPHVPLDQLSVFFTNFPPQIQLQVSRLEFASTENKNFLFELVRELLQLQTFFCLKCSHNVSQCFPQPSKRGFDTVKHLHNHNLCRYCPHTKYDGKVLFSQVFVCLHPGWGTQSPSHDTSNPWSYVLLGGTPVTGPRSLPGGTPWPGLGYPLAVLLGYPPPARTTIYFLVK